MASSQEDSLQRLSARAVMDVCNNKIEDALQEERETFQKRRESFLLELEKEEASTIQMRKDEILNSLEATHLRDLRDMVGFCKECNHFYEYDPCPSCSVQGCTKHLECPCTINDGLEERIFDAFRGEWYSVTQEQIGYWSWYCGEQDCWICKETFCKYHFFEHYEACREGASSLCGFRPPTEGNLFEGFLCVYGHCGRDMRDREVEFNFCERADNSCGTVTCEVCSEFCYECSRPHCRCLHEEPCAHVEDTSSDEE